MARHSPKFKAKAVARLGAPESATLQAVAHDSGIGVDTLERWRDELASRPARRPAWSAAARFDAVLSTATLDARSKSAWCREHGLYPAQLEQWQASAVAALADQAPTASSDKVAARQDKLRIKQLERDLLRKDRALAETAALLVLSKKVAAIWNNGEAV